MAIIVKVGGALQEVFGAAAEAAAAATGVIVRLRKFSPTTLARTFVLGFLRDPNASDEKLAQLAAECGVDVTPQAIEQRHTPKLVAFFKDLFTRAVAIQVGGTKALAPILERFVNVTVLDSTTIVLPDSAEEEFPGCGGSHGGGKAALKLQTELDLRSGAITHVAIEPGRSPDAATGRQAAHREPGSLRITDLGYFSIDVFAELTAAKAFFLSRLQYGTHVRLPDGTAVNLLAWLARQPGPFVDQSILLGEGQRLPCRLIAWRLPPEQANRRRQKLRQETLKRKGREPSAERLAWCDWTILVTNVPPELLTPEEAVVLYRARWQVELLFKRWKSQDRVAVLRGSTPVRQMVGIWARLLAALVQHWLVVTTVWGDPTKSLGKVCEAVRAFVGRLAAGLDRRAELTRVLEAMARAVAKTCRRNPRAKPGTFELLNDVRRLEFRLT